MGEVIKLSTRADGQHYTVRKNKGAWAVQLVTPSPGRALRTCIAWHGDRDQAIMHGREVAARMHRPFKLGRAAQ